MQKRMILSPVTRINHRLLSVYSILWLSHLNAIWCFNCDRTTNMWTHCTQSYNPSMAITYLTIPITSLLIIFRAYEKKSLPHIIIIFVSNVNIHTYTIDFLVRYSTWLLAFLSVHRLALLTKKANDADDKTMQTPNDKWWLLFLISENVKSDTRCTILRPVFQ